MIRRQLIFRIRFLSVIIGLVGLLLVGRLYQVQIINTDVYLAKAESQYVHTKTDLYSRGSILFTTRDNTTLSAAAIQSGYLLAVNPTHLTSIPEVFCAELEHYIETDIATCITRLTAPDRTYVELAARLTAEQRDEIENKNIPGAMLYKNQWRYYPGELPRGTFHRFCWVCR
jgi:cell division protein FtsI (penicillin-binding protein 3)